VIYSDATADLPTPASYTPIVAAGGAVGYLSGSVSRVQVTVVEVSATTAYSGSELYSLAGGIGGYVRSVWNAKVKGSGAVTASGGVSVASGGAALLVSNMEFVVVSDVSVSASARGWAIGFVSMREDGEVSEVYATIGDESGALIYQLVNDVSVQNCGYLYGSAIQNNAQSGQVENVNKLASLEAFYPAALYAEFDGEVWLIAGDALPTLR